MGVLLALAASTTVRSFLFGLVTQMVAPLEANPCGRRFDVEDDRAERFHPGCDDVVVPQRGAEAVIV